MNLITTVTVGLYIFKSSRKLTSILSIDVNNLSLSNTHTLTLSLALSHA